MNLLAICRSWSNARWEPTRLRTVHPDVARPLHPRHPLVIAVGAALLLLPWIMGASAIQGSAGSQGYTVGMIALFFYPTAYQVLIIAWGICRWRKWSLQRIFLQLIWLSLLLFAVAMSYALVQLQDYLEGTNSQAPAIAQTAPLLGA